jgi:hypothetical protein
VLKLFLSERDEREEYRSKVKELPREKDFEVLSREEQRAKVVKSVGEFRSNTRWLD